MLLNATLLNATLLNATLLNDIHSALNPTLVARLEMPTTLEELCAVVLRANAQGMKISIAGGKHSMGGQQFLTSGVHVDCTALNRVLRKDCALSLIEVEAGIMWPAIIAATFTMPNPTGSCWAIRQKQTGVDDVTLGGSVSVAAHGRGLLMQPLSDGRRCHGHTRSVQEREVLTRLQSSAFSSVYIVGAGFDTLAIRIAATYPEVQFVELDHPATQAVKKLALADQALPANFEFRACDLRTTPVAQMFAQLASRHTQANPKNRLVIVEGLLMYFTSAQVRALLRAALAAQSPSTDNNTCIFSYMEQTDNLPAGFRPRSWLIDRWLAFKNEPFLWSANSAELAEVVAHAGGKIERLIPASDFDGNLSGDAIRGENLVVASRLLIFYPKHIVSYLIIVYNSSLL